VTSRKKVFWTRRASLGLWSARAYIAQENPPAATRVADAIVKRTNDLALLPYQERPGRAPNKRELVIPRMPFIVIYRLGENRIDVLAVLHGARRWPKRL